MTNVGSAVAALGIPQTSGRQPNSLQLQIDIPTSRRWRTLHALLDSGAEENFISQKVIVESKLDAKPVSTRVKSIDGHSINLYGQHAIETHARDMRGINGYTEQKLLATDIVGYDLILGFPWLQAVNPKINWEHREWKYRAVPIEGVMEVGAETFMRDAKKAGSMFVAFLSPVLSQDHDPEQCSMVGAASRNPLEIPKQYADYADVFSEEGAAALPRDARVEHRIEIEAGKQVPFGPIYPLSQRELGILNEYVEQNLATGRIRASLSPAGAPILFVPKQDGSLRLCVDYRGLNKITVKNRYPLPLLSEILDRLSGVKVCTKLDMRDAYHRIPIVEGDIWKTAFRTRYGHFEYTVMPFGLTNAPATFQAYVNEAMRGLLDVTCIAYMDDILIFSKAGEDHASHVRAVLERMREYKLYAKLSKCEFDVEEVSFLGFRVGVAGVSMDTSRVQAIQDWPQPQSFRDIQVFLGFANFYRGFIVGYSRIAAPITDLLVGMQGGRKTGKFEWSASAELAFHELKACFTTAPVLQHFDPLRQSRVEPDASKEAAGGILTQAYKSPAGRTLWRPVAFFSKKFQKEQRNYGTGDQEMLAIVMAFKEWRHYLDAPAHRTIVLSDHEALQSFMTTKQLQGRQIRWAEYLAAFDFEIRWRKGKDNPADGLSRRPDHMVREEDGEHPLKKLILLRTRGPSDPHATSTEERSSGEVWVGVLTRGMLTKVREALPYQILPDPGSRLRDAGEAHELIPIDGNPQLVGVPSVEGMESSAGEAATSRSPARELAPANSDDVACVAKIPTSLENLLLHLQADDPWCRQKAWNSHAGSMIEKGEYHGVWSLDS